LRRRSTNRPRADRRGTISSAAGDLPSSWQIAAALFRKLPLPPDDQASSLWTLPTRPEAFLGSRCYTCSSGGPSVRCGRGGSVTFRPRPHKGMTSLEHHPHHQNLIHPRHQPSLLVVDDNESVAVSWLWPSRRQGWTSSRQRPKTKLSGDWRYPARRPGPRSQRSEAGRLDCSRRSGLSSPEKGAGYLSGAAAATTSCAGEPFAAGAELVRLAPIALVELTNTSRSSPRPSGLKAIAGTRQARSAPPLKRVASRPGSSLCSARSSSALSRRETRLNLDHIVAQLPTVPAPR